MSSASAALTWSSPLFLPQSRHGRVPIHHQSRTCPSLKAPRVDVCGEQRPPAHIAYGGGGSSSSDGLNWRPRQEYPPDHLPHPTSEGLRFLPNQSGERHENPSERGEARGPRRRQPFGSCLIRGPGSGDRPENLPQEQRAGPDHKLRGRRAVRVGFPAAADDSAGPAKGNA